MVGLSILSILIGLSLTALLIYSRWNQKKVSAVIRRTLQLEQLQTDRDWIALERAKKFVSDEVTWVERTEMLIEDDNTIPSSMRIQLRKAAKVMDHATETSR